MTRFTSIFSLCIAFATLVQAAFDGREIVRRPDMCNIDMVDTISWYSEESVLLDVEPVRAGRRLAIPDGSTAAWIVADELGTNWLVRYDLAPTSNACKFALAAGEGRLPPGRDYTGYVTILSGTNVLGVVDRHRVNVAWNPADPGAEAVMPPSEYPPIVDAVQDFLDAAAGQVASNSAAIAARPTFDWVAAYVATNSSGGGGGGVDTNAIVAAAVEAGRSEFYGLDATQFGAGRDLACFGARKGFISMTATSLVYATQLKLGTSDPVSKWSDITPWFMADSDTWGTDVDIFVDGDIHAHSDIFTGSITLGGETRTNWPSGGGGSAWQPTSRVITSATYTVSADDCLVWMDSETAATNQVLNLPDMTNESFTVVVRHLGSDFPTTIRRATATATNTYQLNGDGASVAVDWLGAKNTWYWRQAY